jgi:curved DNA-binding protein CbpA
LAYHALRGKNAIGTGIMANHTREKLTLEKNLSFVMGRPVSLRSPEIGALTPANLKRAYYRRAQELHPDKAASLGLPTAYLEERFRTLTDAYSVILDSWSSGTFAILLGETDEPERPANEAFGWKAQQGGRQAQSSDQRAQSNNQTRQTNYAQSGNQFAHDQARHQANTQQTNAKNWRTENARSAERAGGAGFSRAQTGGTAFTGRSAGNSGNANPFGTADFSQNRTQANSRPRVYHRGDVPPYQLRFAQYLYYTRKIDWDTLIRSLSWQYRLRPKIGDLGTKLGFMGYEEINHVLRLKKSDELFGQTAVHLGVLKPYDLTVLIGRQRLLNLPIGRFFVEQGYLSETELEIALLAMTRHNGSVRLIHR